MRSVVAGRTLLDAAGSLPVAQRETVGIQWLSLAQMPALDDRTIYVVVEPSGVPSGVSRVFGSGADAVGQSLWLRSDTGGKWEVRGRVVRVVDPRRAGHHPGLTHGGWVR